MIDNSKKKEVDIKIILGNLMLLLNFNQKQALEAGAVILSEDVLTGFIEALSECIATYPLNIRSCVEVVGKISTALQVETASKLSVVK